MPRNLKKLLFLFGLLFLFATVSAQTKVPSEIKFVGEIYKLAFQNEVNATKLTEYVRAGETLDKFEKMITYTDFINAKDRKALARFLVNNSSESLKSNPRKIFDNKTDTETIVSMIINTEQVSEYVLYRILMKNGHVVVYQFSYRIYQPTGTTAYKKWLEVIDKNEAKWIAAIVKIKI